MPPPTTPLADLMAPSRLEVLFDEVAELMGQRNALDGRLVAIVAEIDGRGSRDGNSLWGGTGCRSIAALVAWMTGMSPRNADTVVAVAHRIDDLPRLTTSLAEGVVSLDQVGVIAEKAAPGCDDHYAELAKVATVTQLRTAVKQEPRPEPESTPEPKREFSRVEHDGYTNYRIRLPKLEAAKFDTAMASHKDGLIADWKRDRETEDRRDIALGEVDPDVALPADPAPPFPTNADAFMSLIEAGWDTETAARPHGAHTTVIAHYDVGSKVAALHLGPVLSDAERQLLLCDATCEVWLQRHGRPIGAGRATRTISRRLRRALEHRDTTCVVPGCGATRGLHAHHLIHWEDGGPTELHNLVLVCPYHHRLHHKRELTLIGPADQLRVTDRWGQQLTSASLARPPTGAPPHVAPCRGPSGERAQWWWYTPFQPEAPPSDN